MATSHAANTGGESMSLRMILLPLFVEVALTFVLMFWMAAQRRSAFAGGEVSYDDIALREPNWPRRTLAVANAYHNQLELPLLFYVLTILAYNTRHAGLLFLLLAWVFVVMRLLQAYVHVTSNRVALRGAFFMAGGIVLAIMWAIFVVEILLGI
jgi:hypothetical protein